MKKKTVFIWLAIAIVIIAGCSNRTQTSMMRNVTGKPGELVVVISPDKWNAEPGDVLKALLMQPQYGLPQDEPLLKVINIPKEAYADIFRTSRNIIEVEIGNQVAESSIVFKKDVHAYTQALVVLKAKNNNDFLKLVTENKDRLVGYFLNAEKDRLLLNYSKYHEKAIQQKTEDQFGITMNVPPGFHVDEEKDNFMWMRYDAPEISQGILVYSYPYTHDSTFTSNYMVTRRNLVTKNNVPGPTDGSYMTTEMELPVMYHVFKHNGNYAAEMRGLWKLENDFMGGPFVSLSVLDLLKGRVVTVEGYVYGPNTDKRNYLRQVEAMIYSMKFINQEDMDKLNKQVE